MLQDKLVIKTAIQIQKPAEEIFEAIVDPEKMKNYFISESNGRMVKGKELIWKFPEFEAEVTVEVTEQVPNELISFKWEGVEERKLQVEITLNQTQDNNGTIVKITEGEMNADEIGIKWLGENTEGWANFLACLKAYLEYGINLRKGAFEFRRGEM